MPNEAELEKKAKMRDLKEHYENNLAWLKEKYELANSLPVYANKHAAELVKAITDSPQDPKIVLQALIALNEKDPSLDSLQNSALAKRIKQGEFYSLIKGFQERPLLRQVLDICELSADESAIFVMYLAQTNKNLMGLSYADLKDDTFKWR